MYTLYSADAKNALFSYKNAVAAVPIIISFIISQTWFWNLRYLNSAQCLQRFGTLTWYISLIRAYHFCSSCSSKPHIVRWGISYAALEPGVGKLEAVRIEIFDSRMNAYNWPVERYTAIHPTTAHIDGKPVKIPMKGLNIFTTDRIACLCARLAIVLVS